MKKRHNFLWVITAMVLVAFAFSKEFLPATHPDNTLSNTLAGTSAADATDLHFINVGQGDAELIVCGEDAVLIDGGKASAGSTVVDYLSRQGIAELDAVIATHPHEDHIGGLINVLDAFQVDAFYMSDEAMDTDIYENLLDAILPLTVGTICSSSKKSSSIPVKYAQFNAIASLVILAGTIL